MSRKKFRTAMKDEIMVKAPGMKYVLDARSESNNMMAPRVIHALGEYLNSI